MIVLQLILFCAVFTLMVKLGVGNNALNGLCFYPKAVQERVYELGLTDRQTVKRKRKIFMTIFFIVMLVVLLLMIGLWNGVRDFPEAYLQALLFLEIMNWYDGIVIDRLSVGHSKFWMCRHHLIRKTESSVTNSLNAPMQNLQKSTALKI